MAQGYAAGTESGLRGEQLDGLQWRADLDKTFPEAGLGS